MTEHDVNLVPPEESWDFVHLASLYLTAVMPPMPEDRFWDLVEQIGWGARPSAEWAGARLAKQLRLVDCVAAANQAREQGQRMRERLEDWERDSGARLPLSDQAFMDLIHHVVGLGQGEVHKLTLDPALALRRAERRDFRHSFLDVFRAAAERYPPPAWSEALESAGTPRSFDPSVALEDGALLEHPVHGLGLVRAADSQGRPRLVFEGGDLLIERGGLPAT